MAEQAQKLDEAEFVQKITTSPHTALTRSAARRPATVSGSGRRQPAPIVGKLLRQTLDGATLQSRPMSRAPCTSSMPPAPSAVFFTLAGFLLENHRLVAMKKDAILDVPANGAGKHHILEVAAFFHQVLERVAM